MYILPIYILTLVCYNIIKLKGARDQSKEETTMKANTRKAVCSTANALVKLGYSRSEAMRQAWRIAKLPDITVKVKGTASAPLRQTALEHLPRYSPEDVSFKIAADVNNPVDKNAVAVIAGVKNKGSFLIGYLPKELAANISPFLTSGVKLYTTGTVTGGYEPYMNYGARITIAFA